MEAKSQSGKEGISRKKTEVMGGHPRMATGKGRKVAIRRNNRIKFFLIKLFFISKHT